MNKSLLLAAFLLSGCAAAYVEPQAAPAPAAAPLAAAPQADASARLQSLFKESDEANLRRNPLSALFRGDMRYADQLGDNITNAYYAAERAAAQSELRQLTSIDRSALSATDQLAYDVFKRQTEMSLRGLTPEMLGLTAVRPIDHFFGFHTFYPDLASGEGAAPFKTVEDYENNLKRHRQFRCCWTGRSRAFARA